MIPCARTRQCRTPTGSNARSETLRRGSGRCKPRPLRSMRPNRRLKRSTEETEHASQRMTQAERRMAESASGQRGPCRGRRYRQPAWRQPARNFRSRGSGRVDATRFRQGACAELRALVAERREQIAVVAATPCRSDDSRSPACATSDNARRKTGRSRGCGERREQADADGRARGPEPGTGLGAPLRQPEATAGQPRRRARGARGPGRLGRRAGWRQPGAGISLQAAQQQASLRLAQRRVSLDGQRQTLETERDDA